MKRVIVFMLTVGAMIAIIAGCDDTPENARSVVVAALLNDGVPYISDVLEQGDSLFDATGTSIKRVDDFIAEDWAPVVFTNRPYSGALVTTAPGHPHGEYLVESYRIEYQRIDGGTSTFPPYQGYTSIMVPSGEAMVGAIVIVPAEYKRLPPVNDICYDPVAPPAGFGCTNAGDEIFMRAVITFKGREAGTDRESEFVSSLTLNLFDWVIETPDKD